MGVFCLLLSLIFSFILELVIGNLFFVRLFFEGYVILKFDMIECIKEEFDIMIFKMDLKEKCFLILRLIINFL